MNRSGIAMFLIIVLGVWTAVHLYVCWRMASVPFIASHLSRRALILIALALWLSYPLARVLCAQDWPIIAQPLEFIGAIWIGVLFLLFSAFLVTEVVTLGGLVVPGLAPRLRGWATVTAGVLSAMALVQGLRAPIVRDYEVSLPGLPRERDGLVLVDLSDLHLGSLIGRRWLARLLDRVQALRPDLVVVVGDVIDGNAERTEPLVPALRKLKAPLGVWAVTGNHEFYAGLERSIALFEQAGFHVLRDGSAQVAPGLVLAGVDDLTARAQFGLADHPIQTALANRPPGATIFLCHSPWQAETAARLGAGLMLCGHTHNGQIWPFTYLVQTRYPLIAGRYQVGKMTVIVGRGTGTWGPRMRLWQPGEIVRIRLKAAN
jgi:predicted MPP superfamily phosphohydrolase